MKPTEKNEISDLFYFPGYPLYFLLKEAEKRGLNVKKALKKAGLEESVLKNPAPGIINLKKFIAFTNYLENESGDPSFYFSSFQNTIAPEKYDIVAMLVLNMPTLRTALRMGLLTTHVTCNYIYFDSVRGAGDLANAFYFLTSEPKAVRAALEMMYVNASQILSLFTSGKGKFRRVDFPYDPVPYKNKLEEFFQCPVYFNQKSAALVFPEEYLEIQNPSMPSQNTLNFLFQKGNAEWCRRCHSGMTGKVRREIFRIIRSESPTLEKIAENLFIHPRLLQKEMQREGTSFREIFGLIRLKRGMHLIFGSSMSFEEIAVRTGFENAASFNNYFKRITGKTPFELRQQKLSLVKKMNEEKSMQ